MKKVVILGGGTGTSLILSDLKNINCEITVIVTVSDDGASTGKLRKEFDIPGVGDIRKVLSSLSTLPKEYNKFMEYRFVSESDLNNHAIGNLIITSFLNQGYNLKTVTEYLSDLLQVKHKVLPLSNDCLTLMKETVNNKIIEGQVNINLSDEECKRLFYKEKVKVLPEVLTELKNADLIILSMGSLYTSLLPHLICEEVKNEIINSNAKVMYICNTLTEPGETDKYTVSKHIDVINKYLGTNVIDVVIANNKIIDKDILKDNEKIKGKDLVTIDYENINNLNIELIEDELLEVINNQINYNSKKLSNLIEKYIKE